MNKIGQKKPNTEKKGEMKSSPTTNKTDDASFRVKTFEEIMAEKRNLMKQQQEHVQQQLSGKSPSPQQDGNPGLQMFENKSDKGVCNVMTEVAQQTPFSDEKETVTLPEYLPLSPVANRPDISSPVISVAFKRKWHHRDAYSTPDTRVEEKSPKIHKVHEEQTPHTTAADVSDVKYVCPPTQQVSNTREGPCTSDKPESMQIEDWESEMADFEAFLMDV